MNSHAHKCSQAQWAGQFAVAAELSRRGYIVTFTMGNNTPVADLMVGTTAGAQFWVDVKCGLSKARQVWLMRPKPLRQNMFYIFAHMMPMDIGRSSDKFFILSQVEANALNNGDPKMPSVSYPLAEPHLDRWDKLPDPAAS